MAIPTSLSTFSARLKAVLGSRKPTPWSENLLIPSGTMSRMFKGDGVPPTYETLGKITRTENLSLSWLLDGIGAPYLIALIPDSAEMCAEVEARMQEEPAWNLHVITDGQLLIAALNQPAQIVEKRGEIDYVAVDVLAGFASSSVMDLLAGYRNQVTLVKRTREQLLQAVRDGVGTFELFGSISKLGADEGRALAVEDASYGAGFIDDPRHAPLRAGIGRLNVLMPDMRDEELGAAELLIACMLDRVESRKRS